MAIVFIALLFFALVFNAKERKEKPAEGAKEDKFQKLFKWWKGRAY